MSSDSEIHSDDSTSCADLSEVVDQHRAKIISKQEINRVLSWVHIAISNAKRMLLDIHHHIRPEHLQSYLNKFCCKFDRRYFGEALFDRLMTVCVDYKNNLRHYSR